DRGYGLRLAESAEPSQECSLVTNCMSQIACHKLHCIGVGFVDMVKPMMRPSIFALMLSLSAAMAGQLDVAVIRFAEAKDPGVLGEALAKVRLAEMTDADRTRTSVPQLKNGTVLFAQSFPANPGSKFATSTRVGNTRADVEGSLGAGSVALSIGINEGVQAGLRNFQNRSYTGSAPLVPGPATVISVRRVENTAPKVLKGQSSPSSEVFTIILVAQFTP
ncbi:MAG: hypothetical protein WEB60_03765, partial [Terrimicrobiaceae bacterium]